MHFSLLYSIFHRLDVLHGELQETLSERSLRTLIVYANESCFNPLFF